MKIILMGLPGSGKGTQSKSLSPILDIPHISTGDILRQAIALSTPLGLIAKEKVARGDFLDDQFTISFVKDRLSKEDCQRGFILDGFPRTLPQAQGFVDFDVAVFLDVSPELALQRILGRLMGADGMIYHERFQPPAAGLETKKRKDDTEQMARRRLSIFEAQTRPIIDYYKSLNKLISVAGDIAKESVSRQILKALESF
jgi:adenylate kinase